jgi:hypothetical protein
LQGDSLVLVAGGSLGFNAGGSQKTAALYWADLTDASTNDPSSAQGVPPQTTDGGRSAESMGPTLPSDIDVAALLHGLSWQAQLPRELWHIDQA